MIYFFVFFLVLVVIVISIEIAVTIAALKRLERSQESLVKAIEELKKRLR